MLRPLIAIFRHGLDLWDRINKLEARLLESCQEQARLKEQIDRLTNDQQRDRETATHEREKLVLQLEVMMLKFERRLPPAKPAKDK